MKRLWLILRKYMHIIKFSIIVNILFSLTSGQSNKIIFKPSFAIGAGYTKIENIGTIAVPSSYYLEVTKLPLLAFINFADFAFENNTIPFDSDRYRMDTFSSGQRRCRDKTNGQFVKTSLCEDDTESITHFSISADINYRLPTQGESLLHIGLGYRLLKPSTPYINFIAFYSLFREHDYLIKTSVGQDYLHFALYYSIPYSF